MLSFEEYLKTIGKGTNSNQTPITTTTKPFVPTTTTATTTTTTTKPSQQKTGALAITSSDYGEKLKKEHPELVKHLYSVINPITGKFHSDITDYDTLVNRLQGTKEFQQTTPGPIETVKKTAQYVSKQTVLAYKFFERMFNEYQQEHYQKIVDKEISVGILNNMASDINAKASLEVYNKATEINIQAIDTLSAEMQKIAEPLFDDNPNLSQWQEYVFTMGSGFASLAQAYAIFALTKNPSIAAAYLSAVESTGVYDEARRAGKDPATARRITAISGIGTFILEKIGLDFLFKGIGQGFFRNLIVTPAFETGQELLQTIWQNLVKNVGYDNTQDIFDGMWETIVATFIPTMAFGVPANAIQIMRTQQYNKTKEIVSTAIAQEAKIPIEEVKEGFDEAVKIIVDQRDAFMKIGEKIIAEEKAETDQGIEPVIETPSKTEAEITTQEKGKVTPKKEVIPAKEVVEGKIIPQKLKPLAMIASQLDNQYEFGSLNTIGGITIAKGMSKDIFIKRVNEGSIILPKNVDAAEFYDAYKAGLPEMEKLDMNYQDFYYQAIEEMKEVKPEAKPKSRRIIPEEIKRHPAEEIPKKELKKVIKETTGPIEGKKVIPEKAALKAVMKGQEKAAKIATEFTRKQAKAEIKNIEDSFNKGEKIKTRLANFVRNVLPQSERGKLITQIKNAKNEGDAIKAISKVAQVYEDYAQKSLLGKVKNELDKGKPKKEKGILKGQYGPEYYKVRDKILEHL